jgi:ribonuclease P protein component
MVRTSRRTRLSGAGAFEAVFRNGRRRDGDYLQLVTMAAAREHGRRGFVISRKALPLAVDRNRMRRLLRVALGKAPAAIDAYDMIVRLKRGARREEFPLIVAEAEQLLAGLAARPRAP